VSRFIEGDTALIKAKKRWKDLFEIELAYDKAMRAAVERLDSQGLAQLSSDADLFGQTNCGWYEYRAMHVAAAEARWRIQTAALVPDGMKEPQ
jgi:hypothetical protein